MNLNFISETQVLSIVIIVFIFLLFSRTIPPRNFARNKFYHMKDPDRIDLLGNRHYGYTSTPWKRYLRGFFSSGPW